METESILRTSSGITPVLVRTCRQAGSDETCWTLHDLRPTQSGPKWFAVFEHARGGILVADPVCDTIEMVNPAFAAMHGCCPEELIGQHAVGLITPNSKAIWLEHLMHLGAQGCGRCECTYVRKDGSVFPARTDSILIKDEDGQPLYRVDYVKDLSRERARNAAARKHVAALRQRAEALARSNAELENFARFVAHDLRAPLATLSGCLELIADQTREAADPPLGEYITSAQHIVNDMGELIRNMLDYSRVGATLVMGPCDCEAVLNRVLGALRAGIQSAAARVTHDPLPTIHADEGQIARVFQNLIENAIKYRSDRRPEIHVSARREANEWVFAVRDNGIGIPPESVASVFQLFTRLEVSRSGAGIGLAVSKKIIERHRGRMWADSRLGEGTTIFLSIPD